MAVGGNGCTSLEGDPGDDGPQMLVYLRMTWGLCQRWGGGSGAQGPHLKIQMPPGPAFGAADLGNPNVTSGVSPDPLRLGESEAQPKGAPPTRPTIPCGDSQQGGRHFHASPAHLVSALAQRRDLLRTC